MFGIKTITIPLPPQTPQIPQKMWRNGLAEKLLLSMLQNPNCDIQNHDEVIKKSLVMADRFLELSNEEVI